MTYSLLYTRFLHAADLLIFLRFSLLFCQFIVVRYSRVRFATRNGPNKLFLFHLIFLSGGFVFFSFFLIFCAHSSRLFLLSLPTSHSVFFTTSRTANELVFKMQFFPLDASLLCDVFVCFLFAVVNLWSSDRMCTHKWALFMLSRPIWTYPSDTGHCSNERRFSSFALSY